MYSWFSSGCWEVTAAVEDNIHFSRADNFSIGSWPLSSLDGSEFSVNAISTIAGVLGSKLLCWEISGVGKDLIFAGNISNIDKFMRCCCYAVRKRGLRYLLQVSELKFEIVWRLWSSRHVWGPDCNFIVHASKLLWLVIISIKKKRNKGVESECWSWLFMQKGRNESSS